jgi:hypothetical protein
MNRGITLVGASLLLSSGLGAVAAQAPARGTAASKSAAKEAPKFEVDPMWPKPLANRWILGSSVGVAVDSRDHVYMVHMTDTFTPRTEIGLSTDPPTGECCAPAPNVLEYDAAGSLVNHWGGPGAGYDWPAQNTGLAVDDSGNVWIGGAGGQDSRILKFSRDGKFIAEFGKAPVVAAAAPAPARGPDTAYTGASPGRGAAGRGGGRGGRGGGRGGPPPLPANSSSTDSFGGPAGFSFDAKANEAYVADGTRNHRVAVIDMTTGAIKRFWGAYGEKPNDADTVKYEPGGAAPKQFGSPVLCAKLSNDGLVYVCDTQNDRIQVFKKDGSFVKEVFIDPNTYRSGSVWDLTFSRDPQQTYIYAANGVDEKINILLRSTLEVLTSFGDGGRGPGQFFGVHNLATDSKGNLYATETYTGARVQRFLFKGVGPVTKSAQGVVWPKSR